MNFGVLQVFVSSTWHDLRPERDAARATLDSLRATKFRGMEFFGSRPETTMEASLRDVDRSQVYVAIFGGRYGSGITEAEYRRARKNGLPCFIYFKAEVTIPRDQREADPEKAQLLANLKAELRRGHVIPCEFNNLEQFQRELTVHLFNWVYEDYLPPLFEKVQKGEISKEQGQGLLAAVVDKRALDYALVVKTFTNPRWEKERRETVLFNDGRNVETWGILNRALGNDAAFEVSLETDIRKNQIIHDLQIWITGKLLYLGTATVKNLINVGASLICEVTLADAWLGSTFEEDSVEEQMTDFVLMVKNWESFLFRITPRFKAVTSGLQEFLIDTRRWLSRLESGVGNLPTGDRESAKQEAALKLAPSVLQTLGALFAEFEAAAGELPAEVQPIHRSYASHKLQPWLLGIPFLQRSIQKPLGYAGDYEMLNLMFFEPSRGTSIYRLLLEKWLSGRPWVRASCDIQSYMSDRLSSEIHRVHTGHGKARIFNLGCGAARDIELLLTRDQASESAEIHLCDFNDETLEAAAARVNGLNTSLACGVDLRFIKSSVHQILKGATLSSPGDLYDVIYCCGLIEYLSDRISRRLFEIFFRQLKPGGVLIVSNLDPSHPDRYFMEHLLDWHLICRGTKELQALRPVEAEAGWMTFTKVAINNVVEIRKPLELERERPH